MEVREVINYDYLEGKKHIEIPNYRQILESFEGVNPLHVAIVRNSYECVRHLLEETNIDAVEKTDRDETSVMLACKHAVDIQILESLLVSLRTVWPIEKVKEFLDMKDVHQQLCAYDYCKLKKRSDLAVVLEEFVDTSKSVLDITFSYAEDYDFKAVCRQMFQSELDSLTKLDVKLQYTPMQEPFLKSQMKIRFDKCVGKQMKPIKFTPFTWVDTLESLTMAVEEMKTHLSECNLLSVDLEYHTFARVSIKIYQRVSIAHEHHQSSADVNLSERLHHRCHQSEATCNRSDERYFLQSIDYKDLPWL